MGQIVKQLSEHSTRYYWYPGEKRDWIRAAVAVGIGLAGIGVLLWVTADVLISVTLGVSVTAAMAGVNFGRRDYRAANGFPELSGRAARRAAMVHASRAAWRGLVEGCGGAAAAGLIAHLPPRRLVADWILPIVPATAGALAHQARVLYERLAPGATPRDLPPG